MESVCETSGRTEAPERHSITAAASLALVVLQYMFEFFVLVWVFKEINIYYKQWKTAKDVLSTINVLLCHKSHCFHQLVKSRTKQLFRFLFFHQRVWLGHFLCCVRYRALCANLPMVQVRRHRRGRKQLCRYFPKMINAKCCYDLLSRRDWFVVFLLLPPITPGTQPTNAVFIPSVLNAGINCGDDVYLRY